MSGIIVPILNHPGRKKVFLFLCFFIWGLTSCQQMVVSPPRVMTIPGPSSSPSLSGELSEEEVARTARIILDLPPPVPILPPLKEEIKIILPPEKWKIVINKTERKLYLYQKGDLLKMYPVDLGKNPKGPKIYQGDMKTPEGDYRVVEKRGWGHTNFYLAFLLNYPNETDRRRYETAVMSGLVPSDVGIGSLIEIHGEGMGWDWTKGCIALHNNHMQELFSQVPVGTSVRIEP